MSKNDLDKYKAQNEYSWLKNALKMRERIWKMKVFLDAFLWKTLLYIKIGILHSCQGALFCCNFLKVCFQKCPMHPTSVKVFAKLWIQFCCALRRREKLGKLSYWRMQLQYFIWCFKIGNKFVRMQSLWMPKITIFA